VEVAMVMVVMTVAMMARFRGRTRHAESKYGHDGEQNDQTDFAKRVHSFSP
jgi:hypothetical protein